MYLHLVFVLVFFWGGGVLQHFWSKHDTSQTDD